MQVGGDSIKSRWSSMFNNYYGYIVKAKEIVDEVLSEYDIIDLCNDARILLHNRVLCSSINMRAAFLTVLATGCIVNGTQFMMPSTYECLYHFRDIRNRLSKGRKIEVPDFHRYCDEWIYEEWVEWIRI